jgi:uncharacterized protein with NAD-binding domain and iron-sulfur cluster
MDLELKLEEKQEETDWLVEKLDFLDILILRKFYITKEEFPNDVRSYCFPLLYKEIKNIQKIKIKSEALRRRLENFTKLNLLEKVKNSNPSVYLPKKGKEIFIKKVITKFLMLSGLKEYL